MAADGTNVAIACQGGGSHTAFTAGVLSEILPNLPESYNLVGFSGTSGGAACAAIGWYELMMTDGDPRSALTRFWRDLAATSPLHRTANTLIRLGIELQRLGVPVPDVSPANSPASRWGQAEYRSLLESYIDFGAIPELLADTEEHPALFLSAIDVLSGRFRLFREDELSAEAILASAAEPHLFEAVEVNGNHYWDGLFSKNPPLDSFMAADDIPDPDEIWLIKINPQERDRVPQSPEGINDRRNELAGNLSLNSEVSFIERVNDWIAGGYLPERYTHTEIRRIRFAKGARLDWRTKLDRDPDFIEKLLEDGRERGRQFLEERRAADGG